jgi:hypothetical protein
MREKEFNISGAIVVAVGEARQEPRIVGDQIIPVASVRIRTVSGSWKFGWTSACPKRKVRLRELITVGGLYETDTGEYAEYYLDSRGIARRGELYLAGELDILKKELEAEQEQDERW